MLLLTLVAMIIAVFALLALPVLLAPSLLRRDKWLSLLAITLFAAVFPAISYYFGQL